MLVKRDLFVVEKIGCLFAPKVYNIGIVSLTTNNNIYLITEDGYFICTYPL